MEGSRLGLYVHMCGVCKTIDLHAVEECSL